MTTLTQEQDYTEERNRYTQKMTEQKLNENCCINCGFKVEGWKEVTQECEVRLALTTTEDKLGYLIISHKGKDIGSFNFNNIFTYYNGAGGVKTVEKNYKVWLIPPKGDLGGYFKVYSNIQG